MTNTPDNDVEVSAERLEELVVRTLVPKGRDAYGLGNDETRDVNSAMRELQRRREKDAAGAQGAPTDAEHAVNVQLSAVINSIDRDGMCELDDDDIWWLKDAMWPRGGGAAPADVAEVVPIRMVLNCPSCLRQHVDAPDERTPDWTNPPHKSHLCHYCGTIWRPADVPTVGVWTTETRGKADVLKMPPCGDETLHELKRVLDARKRGLGGEWDITDLMLERAITALQSGQQETHAGCKATEDGWFLPRDRVNSLQAASIDRAIERCRHAHAADLDLRINGQSEHYEADWVKHMRVVPRPTQKCSLTTPQPPPSPPSQAEGVTRG